MRKRIFLGILLVLLILPVFASAGSIPEPPHLGLWVLRDGQLLPVKAVNVVEKVGVRGFATGKEIKEIFILKKTDQILFYFGHNPAETAHLSYLKFVDVIGNPYSGMHRIDLLTHSFELPFKVNPLGVVRGVSLYEIIIDFEKDFLIGNCSLHFGYLTSSFTRNPTAYIFEYQLE
ncbi:MAG: hypothetical protein V1891_00135 [bacterium]